MTGLPALSVPAGFTQDGLPIGLELLGRPLADADLLALAYDYEQAVRPRRAPSTTPPLVNGRAAMPLTFATTARGAGVSARGVFAFDATRRSLRYDVRVSGPLASHMYAVSLVRDSAGKPGPIVRRLTAQGATQSSGSLVLGHLERRDLLEGRLALALFADSSAGGTTRSQPLVAAPVRNR